MTDPLRLLRAARRKPGSGFAEWVAKDGSRIVLTAPRRSSPSGWWKLSWEDADATGVLRRGVRIDPQWAGDYSRGLRRMAKAEFDKRFNGTVSP